MKNIVSLFLLLLSFWSYGQSNVLGVPQNSATTQNKIDDAKSNINQSYAAYIEGNLEKTKYFIDQSQKDGVKNGDFYFLLGAYMYHTKEIKAAKRYWKIAFKEGGCWECKQFLEKLENDLPLESELKKKAKTYVVNLK